MRGKGTGGVAMFVNKGITPAYAGKSTTAKKAVNNSWDHPRLCGEKR